MRLSCNLNHTQCTILYASVGVECKNNDVRRTDVVPPLVQSKHTKFKLQFASIKSNRVFLISEPSTNCFSLYVPVARQEHVTGRS